MEQERKNLKAGEAKTKDTKRNESCLQRQQLPPRPKRQVPSCSGQKFKFFKETKCKQDDCFHGVSLNCKYGQFTRPTQLDYIWKVDCSSTFCLSRANKLKLPCHCRLIQTPNGDIVSSSTSRKYILKKTTNIREKAFLSHLASLKNPKVDNMYVPFFCSPSFVLMKRGWDLRNFSWSEENSDHLMRSALVKLGYLASLKIVHRDIKRSNLILYENEVRFSDFETARIDDFLPRTTTLPHFMESFNPKEEIQRTSENGTHCYCCPSVLIGVLRGIHSDNPLHEQKSDVWALGMTWLSMLVDGDLVPEPILEQNQWYVSGESIELPPGTSQSKRAKWKQKHNSLKGLLLSISRYVYPDEDDPLLREKLMSVYTSPTKNDKKIRELIARRPLLQDMLTYDIKKRLTSVELVQKYAFVLFPLGFNISSHLERFQTCSPFFNCRFEEIRVLQHHDQTKQDFRFILVEWLLDVATAYGMSYQTWFLGVEILDRFFEKVQCLRNSELQLTGVSAFYIASALVDVLSSRLTIPQAVYIAANTYTSSQYKRMIKRVLQTLDYNVVYPTILTFLQPLLWEEKTTQRKNAAISFEALPTNKERSSFGTNSSFYFTSSSSMGCECSLSLSRLSPESSSCKLALVSPSLVEEEKEFKIPGFQSLPDSNYENVFFLAISQVLTGSYVKISRSEAAMLCLQPVEKESVFRLPATDFLKKLFRIEKHQQFLVAATT